MTSTTSADPSAQQNLVLGIVFVALSAIFFGMIGPLAVFAKEEGVNRDSFLAMRFAVGFLGLIIWGAAKGKLKGIDYTTLLIPLTLGAGFYFVQSWLYFTAIPYIGVGLTGVLLYIYPAVIVLVSWLFYKNTISKPLWLSLVMALTGVSLCISGSEINVEGFQGIFYALGAGLVYSGYLLVGEAVLGKHSPTIVAACTCLGASVSFFITSFFTEGFTPPPSLTSLGYILAIGILSTMGSILLLFEGIKILGTSKAAILATLEPVTAVAIGSGFMGEKLGLLPSLGIFLVLTSVVIIAAYDREADSQPQPGQLQPSQHPAHAPERPDVGGADWEKWRPNQEKP